jgi:hypothetical protein
MLLGLSVHRRSCREIKLVPVVVHPAILLLQLEAFFSQPASDPRENNDDCTGIGYWLTEKYLGTRNFGIHFLKLISVMSAGTSSLSLKDFYFFLVCFTVYQGKPNPKGPEPNLPLNSQNQIYHDVGFNWARGRRGENK